MYNFHGQLVCTALNRGEDQQGILGADAGCRICSALVSARQAATPACTEEKSCDQLGMRIVGTPSNTVVRLLRHPQQFVYYIGFDSNVKQ